MQGIHSFTLVFLFCFSGLGKGIYLLNPFVLNLCNEELPMSIMAVCMYVSIAIFVYLHVYISSGMKKGIKRKHFKLFFSSNLSLNCSSKLQSVLEFQTLINVLRASARI